MSLLSPADIASIRRDVASDLSDTIAEVWRDIDPTNAISSNVGPGGFPITTGSSGAQYLTEYACRFAKSGVGDEKPFGGQPTLSNTWQFSFNGGDNPDIRSTDILKIKQTVWTPLTAVRVGTIRQPTASNGFEYVCTQDGLTDSTEPTWGTTLPVFDGTSMVYATITDGSAIWQLHQGLRTFQVKDPGGATTYDIIRVVRCVEIDTPFRQ